MKVQTNLKKYATIEHTTLGVDDRILDLQDSQNRDPPAFGNICVRSWHSD